MSLVDFQRREDAKRLLHLLEATRQGYLFSSHVFNIVLDALPRVVTPKKRNKRLGLEKEKESFAYSEMTWSFI